MGRTRRMTLSIAVTVAVLALPLALPGTGQAAVGYFSGNSVGANYLNQTGGHSGGMAWLMKGDTNYDNDYSVALGVDGQGNHDYCTYYSTNSTINQQDQNDQSGATGFAPPSPIMSYQEWDNSWTTCQAAGTTWGMRLQGTGANSYCSTVCGMHHFASAAGDGVNDKPWASNHEAFVISAHVDPFTAYTQQGVQAHGAWGYVCPLLKDTASNVMIEYCLQDWTWGTPSNQLDTATQPTGPAARACNVSVSVNGTTTFVPQVITDFSWRPSTGFATYRAGSATDFAFTGSNGGSQTFSAAISPQNLVNAVNAVNKTCPSTYQATTNPANWAYVGTEVGHEAYGLNEVGSSSSSLSATGQFDTLFVNQRMYANDQLTSPNGSYRAVMQGDGNFVVYNSSGGAIWSTGTWGHSGAWLNMQSDGNLVVYSSSNQPLWASNTSGTGSNNFLWLGNDGRLGMAWPTGVWYDTE